VKEPVDCHHSDSFGVLGSLACKSQNVEQKFPSRTCNITKVEERKVSEQ